MQKRISSQLGSGSQSELVLTGAALCCLILGESCTSYLRWTMNTEPPHASAQVLHFMEEDKKMNIKMVIPSIREKSTGFVVHPVSLSAACSSPRVLRASQEPSAALEMSPLCFPTFAPGPSAPLWMQTASSPFSLKNRNLWFYLRATALSGWSLYT